jgi:type VI protein secretion system component VasF
MKPHKGTYETRASRARRDLLKRLFVWAFIVFFALSVAGGLIVVSASIAAH